MRNSTNVKYESTLKTSFLANCFGSVIWEVTMIYIPVKTTEKNYLPIPFFNIQLQSAVRDPKL